MRSLISLRWTGRVTSYGGVGSTFAWQIFPTVGVAVGERASLELGYRWISTDYESGDGVTLFTSDILMQGPVFGFMFRP
jgi:hypothetical protein